MINGTAEPDIALARCLMAGFTCLEHFQRQSASNSLSYLSTFGHY